VSNIFCELACQRYPTQRRHGYRGNGYRGMSSYRGIKRAFAHAAHQASGKP
jgi:hypothetical protein